MKLLLAINGHNSRFFDGLMIFFSDKYVWLPFYVVVMGFMYKYYGKLSAIFILVICLFVGISDFSSTHFFKEVFERLRPCHNDYLKPYLHILNCGGRYGFISSHASNVTTFGTFCFFIFWKYNRVIVYTVLLWCLIVCYSRVYLAAHYPSDVFCGMILGVLLGFMGYRISHGLINRRLNKELLSDNNS